MNRVLFTTLLLLAAPLFAADIPHLRRQGTATQLIVDGRPFLIRGGELSNSHGEPDYLRSHWAKLQSLALNTVIAPVYWDVIEPAEGRFDFASVDGLLADARKHDLRLVLLWFGTWKNSQSCYIPAWMKTDPTRFPRARDSAGTALELLTPFDARNRDADVKAFTALLRHLKQVDGARHTVVLVQVENEIGMIPEARDRHPAADAAFAGAVPAELMTYLGAHRDALTPELRERWLAQGGKTSGTWTEVFGDHVATAEIFMAWHFARYTQAVAAAGKTEYPLPMFVNAALYRPGYQPGQYPSAGPLPHLLDLWRAGAPAIDFLSPDIYQLNFAEWADRYTRGGNPLFVPEAIRSPEAAVNSLYVFGAGNGIGFGPFAIEGISDRAAGFLRASNELVRQLTPLIVQHQGKGTITTLLAPPVEQRRPLEIRFGGITLSATFQRNDGPAFADGPGATTESRGVFPAGALVIQTGPDEFILAGTGTTVTFAAPTPGNPILGILNCSEGTFVDGVWKHGRWLNGDQTHQGRHVQLELGRFSVQRVKLYRYR